MPTDDPQLDLIRRRPPYRVALWLVRLAVLPLATYCYLAFAPHHSKPGLAVFGVSALLLLMILGALYLMHRAGVPFVRRRTSWSVTDRKLVQAIQRDVLGLGQR